MYEVKFSIPTPAYPVSQVFVSMFFGIEVSKVVPPVCSVRVTYLLEGASEIHAPDKTQITEEMLSRMANSKLAFYQTFKS